MLHLWYSITNNFLNDWITWNIICDLSCQEIWFKIAVKIWVDNFESYTEKTDLHKKKKNPVYLGNKIITKITEKWNE